jgi:hypothetical protein
MAWNIYAHADLWGQVRGFLGDSGRIEEGKV